MVLDCLAERHDEPKLEVRARLIECAIEAVLESSAAFPMEFGGSANCADMTRAVIAALPDAMRRVA